jgi:hypothetical protein
MADDTQKALETAIAHLREGNSRGVGRFISALKSI